MFHESNKPKKVKSCLWLFYKWNLDTCFYLHVSPSLLLHGVAAEHGKGPTDQPAPARWCFAGGCMRDGKDEGVAGMAVD